jgi:hypothetical protein
MRGTVALVVGTLWGNAALCQEAAEASGSTSWYEPILAAVGVAVATVLVRLINNWAAKEKHEAEIAKQTGKKVVKERVEATLARIVANIANKELKELQEKAADGKISKDELKGLGKLAVDQAKEEFAQEGVNLVNEFGEKYLDSALRNTVDKLKGDS